MFESLLPGVLIVALLLIAAAGFALAGAARLRNRHGLPGGKVVYSDTGPDRRDAKPLYSSRYGLSGKPDYLVATSRGLVPVEVKPERTEPEPRESHVLQVLAYCLLLEETEGKSPPYGLLSYRDDTFKISYNKSTRANLIQMLDEMREVITGGEAHRSHDQPGRCRACLYREACDESLWRAK
jgi:CRISPR-associated exonuclease Cas4